MTRPTHEQNAPSELRQELLALVHRHTKGGVVSQDQLATVCFMVGIMVACLPKDELTIDEVMALFLENMIAGNRHAAEAMIRSHGGWH